MSGAAEIPVAEVRQVRRDRDDRDHCDVVVVGGRVAGSLAAILFARVGLNVVLVDRSKFPSPTLSTHFFRGDGLIRVLDRVDLLPDVEALGAPRLTCEYNYTEGEPVPVVGPPQDPGTAGYCMSVRRVSLDATLLDGVRRAGVRVLTSTVVTGLSMDGGRVTGIVLTNGQAVAAPLVVGADGRRSMVARIAGAADRERHPGVRALYYQYVSDMPGPSGCPPDGPEFSQLGDELAYVFPSDAGLTCVAISVNLDEYHRLRHDLQDGFRRSLRQHRGLWDRYAASRPQGRVLGSGPSPDYVRQAAGAGWALVGDAGMHQDPWTGLGMDSAAIAAEVLVDTFSTQGDWHTWTDVYERRRDEQLLSWFHATVAGAADLSVVPG